MVCEACDGKGWLLVDNSDHGLRFERCDACERFASDETAIQYINKIAESSKMMRLVLIEYASQLRGMKEYTRSAEMLRLAAAFE